METTTAIQGTSDQEIFNRVCAHLAQQKGPSKGGPSANGCAYRGAGGRSCAIGGLFPDAAYLPEMEECSARDLVEREKRYGLAAYIGSNPALLMRLQDAHDEARDAADLRDRLYYVAEYFGIKDTEAVKAITEWNEHQPATA